MKRYVILLRGVNVGGKNKLPMQELKDRLGETGFKNVKTYIQSGNIILDSDLSAARIKSDIETMLTKLFKLNSLIINTLVISRRDYESIVAAAPKHFGSDYEAYRHDVLFLIDYPLEKAMDEIEMREDVDAAWPGKDVIYFQRPSIASPDATKSKLGKISAKPVYASMTIRNWNTCQKLQKILQARASD